MIGMPFTCNFYWRVALNNFLHGVELNDSSSVRSAFIKGVVCSKNVKHKRMVSKHENPRLLLLGGALEHQKVTNKLASINSILQVISSFSNHDMFILISLSMLILILKCDVYRKMSILKMLLLR